MITKEYSIDAKGKVVGRIASEIALLLMGKNTPTYAPNVLRSPSIHVYNIDSMKITGKKRSQKKYYRHSGRIGNLKEETMGNLMRRDSRRVLEYAVFGMLPKNRLRKSRMKNLSLHKGEVEK